VLHMYKDLTLAKKTRKEYELRNKLVIREKARQYRLDNPEKTFIIDSRKNDRKYGREFNLTLEFVETLFKQPCSYCGTTKIVPSPDRIDNDKGHTIENVVPCCRRCNYLRRDIPFPAWLVIAKAVKECHEKGLLDNYDTFDRLANNRSNRKINLDRWVSGLNLCS
jgi:SOS response regulatory protein OraA/RecX